MTVLISLMQETQGMDLFTSGLAGISTSETVVPTMAFGTGLISVYSSTSGVVMPAFLPMVPDLAQQVGAVEPVNLAWSITVGGGLVDLSALSTVGALFLAAAPPGTNTRAPVQRAPRVGALDVRGRRGALLVAVRVGVCAVERVRASSRVGWGWASAP